MVPALIALGSCLALGWLLWAARRAAELAYLRLEGGRLRLRRGRLPPRLLDELRDILDGRAAEGARLWLRVSDGRPEVRAVGVSDDDLQRVRNVVGQFRTPELRRGRVRAR